MMDHRWGTRLPAGFKVHLVVASTVRRIGFLSDVSLSGGFIRLNTASRVPVLFQLAVVLSGRSAPATLHLLARTSRITPSGVGAEWLNFGSPESRRLIHLLTAPDAGASAMIGSVRLYG